jgi:cytoskeletal protein CcmA (bactofilin family)
MLGEGSFFSLVSALFKRRKPDDPAPFTLNPVAPTSATPTSVTSGSVMIGTPLPAGSPTASDSTAEPSDSDIPAFSANAAQPSSDSGLGVPPFRPAPLKDAYHMSRPPFSSSPATPSAPATPVRPGMTTGRPAPRDPSERRTLVVGRGISVQGIVQDAERLVVEGTVEATMIHATELAIAPGGVFKGEVEVEDAEIAGTIDGTLTARGSLIVRSSGRVLGTARCRRLQVEDGGQITGRMEMITDQQQADHPPRQTAEPAI